MKINHQMKKMNREQQLKKELEKEQLKCNSKSYDFKKDKWNSKHFKYCKADLINSELKDIQEVKIKCKEKVEEWKKMYENVRSQCDTFAKKCKVLEKKREYWELKYKKLNEELKL